MNSLLGTKDVSRMTASLPFPLGVLGAEMLISLWAARRVTGRAYVYGIFSGEELFGIVELSQLSNGFDYKIAVHLGQDYWGKGYATEAATAILAAAEETLSVKRFVAEIFLDNPAAINVMHKLGLKFRGNCHFVYSEARMEKVETFVFERDVVQIPVSVANQDSLDLHQTHMSAIQAR